MIEPQNLPITLRRNDKPWRGKFVARVDGTAQPYDFTGHSARLQVRAYAGAPGEPLIEALSSANAGTRLVCTAAGIEAVVYKADIVALPASETAGEDKKLVYDLLVTVPDGDENVWFEGVATVKPGVTLVDDGTPDEEPGETLGPELVTNGDFNSAEGWQIDEGVAVIQGGKLSFTGDGDSVSRSIDGLETGEIYRVALAISDYAYGVTSGSFVEPLVPRGANGAFVQYITSNTNDATLLQLGWGEPASMSIDNVSVRKVL